MSIIRRELRGKYWGPTRLVMYLGRVAVYFDARDWWVGYYRGDDDHYVCPLPCLVVRWRRR